MRRLICFVDFLPNLIIFPHNFEAKRKIIFVWMCADSNTCTKITQIKKIEEEKKLFLTDPAPVKLPTMHNRLVCQDRKKCETKKIVTT